METTTQTTDIRTNLEKRLATIDAQIRSARILQANAMKMRNARSFGECERILESMYPIQDDLRKQLRDLR